MSYINANGGGSGGDWYLMGGFPPKRMTDFGKTIEEEGLGGGQVQQRMA